MSLRTKTLLTGFALIVLMTMVAGLGGWTIKTVQVGGQRYNGIESKADYVDILARTRMNFNLVNGLVYGALWEEESDKAENLGRVVARIGELLDERDAMLALTEGAESCGACHQFAKDSEFSLGRQEISLAWESFRRIMDEDLAPALAAERWQRASSAAEDAVDHYITLMNGTKAEIEAVRGGLEELREQTIAKAGSSSMLFYLISGGAILLVLGVCGVLQFHIVKPIKETSRMFKEIAQGDGDLTRRLLVQSTDEIGDLATSFNTFLSKLQSMVKSLSGHGASVLMASESLSKVSSSMSSGSENMTSRANTVAAAAEQLSNNINSMATGAEQMSATVTSVAAALEEMSASLMEVADNSGQGARIATEANSQAKEAEETVQRLNLSAKEIGKILATINDIADQTNLLALNATIEAASAGEAGKGFAVVANEVKELAKQTSQATDEIERITTEMQSNINSATAAITRVGEIISETNGISQTIAAAVEEQSATTNEIATNMSGASRAASEIAENVQHASTGVGDITGSIRDVSVEAEQTATGASETSTSASELAKMAKQLKKLIGEFKVDKEKFDIAAVKSAHLAWRTRLEQILKGRHSMSSSEVASHHECDFGKWYDNVKLPELLESEVFNEVGEYHEQVHKYAKKIVALVEEDRHAECEELMASFEEVRVSLFEKLDELYHV